MSRLKEKIKSDLLAARQAGDSTRANLLRVIIGEFDRLDIDLKTTTDEHVIAVLIKFKKNLSEVIAAGNAAAKEAAAREIAVVDEYLPRTASEDEIKNLLANTSATNIGQWMKEIASFSQSTGLVVNRQIAADLFNSKGKP